MSAIINENQSFQSTAGVPLVGGFIYIGLQGLDPKLNPKPIFSDRALTVALANPQTLDSLGKSTNKIWTDGSYSMKIEDVNNVQIEEELDNGEASGIGVIALTNVIGINAITASGSPTITALVDGFIYGFEVLSANTADAVTLNIDGLGAKTINRSFNQAVGIARFLVGQKVLVIYNLGNDNFELVNDNRSVVLGVQGADIASATTVDLAAATGNRINVTGHDGPIEGFGTVLAGTVYDLLFPGSAPVTITSSSIANPTNILCAAVHGLTTGDEVIIAGHSTSVPDINGRHTVTVVDASNYTIPVNVTTGGTGGTSTGVPVVTNNATSLIVSSGRDYYPKIGEIAQVQSLGSGNWKLQDPNGTPLVGETKAYIGTVAPDGYILLDGGTIGSLASGATTRAHADTLDLYTLFYNSMADAQAAVSTGRGASAAADFAADKTITISNLMNGSAVVGTGGTKPATHGDSGGLEGVTLVESNMPAHIHGQRIVNDTGGGTAGTQGSSAADDTTAGTTTSTGGDGEHENMPPWVSLSWICRL